MKPKITITMLREMKDRLDRVEEGFGAQSIEEINCRNTSTTNRELILLDIALGMYYRGETVELEECFIRLTPDGCYQVDFPYLYNDYDQDWQIVDPVDILKFTCDEEIEESDGEIVKECYQGTIGNA